MERKLKIKLDDYQDWATRIQCCGEDKWFRSDEMKPLDNYECRTCGKLLLVVCSGGIPYYVGDPVFNRNRH